jgi:hypothetical protein
MTAMGSSGGGGACRHGVSIEEEGKMREQSNEVGDNKVGAPFYKVGGGGEGDERPGRQ